MHVEWIGDCFTGSDYLCQNHRCIPAQLHCDGFDHCGDNSDEPDTCNREWDAEPVDRRWYSHTPNYYFPKMERYPDLKTATLVFVISSLGLILLIAALVVLLYRMGARARQQRELQNRLQTISELLDGARIEEVETDDPPVYEAPPEYEEVIKRKKGSLKRKKNKNRRPRSSSSQRPGSRAASSHSQEVSLQPSAEPTTPLLQQPQSVSRSCQVTPIPDSPPPPYSDQQVTPTHSLRPEETAEVLQWEEQTIRAFSSLPSPSTAITPLVHMMPVDNRSVISIDCNSATDHNDLSLTLEPSQVGPVQESTIFKRRLQRTARRRPNLSLDVDTLFGSRECQCEGACGCVRPVSAEPQRRVHSTWSPASYTLHALDIYFDKLEKGASGCSREHSPLRLNTKGLSLSISMSVDNLKDIV